LKLISCRSERFRNILDTGEVPVDASITCLVGKNESGKTNLLHALDSLNPALGDRSLDNQQYPRWLEKEHKRSGEFEKARPILARFQLDNSEIAKIAETFGEGVLASPEWSYFRKYDGKKYSMVHVNEEAACKAIAQRFRIPAIDAVTIQAMQTALASLAAETEVIAEGDTPRSTDMAQHATAAIQHIAMLYPNQDVSTAIGRKLCEWVPRFFYFDDYSQLSGRTDIKPLIAALRVGNEGSLSPQQRTALCLLRIAFATDQLIDPDYEKASGEMEAVAADLTRQIRKYWHQNDHLRLTIDIEKVERSDGGGQRIIQRLLQLRVLDDRHYFTNNLDARSSGFRWFVSFLAAFKDFESDGNVIVLLDEPALTLHARAQADFLFFIEETLAKRHQVIYTTHSPFMVDAGHLEQVRIVEDQGPEEGAVVRTQLMSRDPDTLSPLQGALGYDIAQNIFVGPDNLVVEGLSDHTYLTVLSEALREAGRKYLNQRWRVLPAGGAGTMPAAIALLGRDLDITVVMDGGSQPPQKMAALVNEGILDGKRIITLGSLVCMKAADIKDLFHPEDYLAIYNVATSNSLVLADLGGDDDRILARIERKAGKFNHNDPANWFLANRATVVSSLCPTTLDRFELLIDAINKTLA